LAVKGWREGRHGRLLFEQDKLAYSTCATSLPHTNQQGLEGTKKCRHLVASGMRSLFWFFSV
jgi:hypothetical protein